MKACPFCAEQIQDDAIKCRHCGSNLKGSPKFLVIFIAAITLMVLLGLVAVAVTARRGATGREPAVAPPASPSPAKPEVDPPAAPGPTTSLAAPPAPDGAGVSSPATGDQSARVIQGALDLLDKLEEEERLTKESEDRAASMAGGRRPVESVTGGERPSKKKMGQLPDAVEGAIVRIEARDWGTGSGFFVSADGYIVTCKHVVEGTSAVDIQMADGTVSLVNIIAVEAEGDLALLKLDGRSDLPFLELREATTVRAGDEVTAVGFPLGVTSRVVTRGIVSASPIRLGDYPYALIQIDAAVNPGNSGGPLLDADAKVIGIVDAKILGRDRMNYATPANYVSLLPWPPGQRLKNAAFDEWVGLMRTNPGGPVEGPATEASPANVAIAGFSQQGRGLTIYLELKDETGRPFASQTTATVRVTWDSVDENLSLDEGRECETFGRFDRQDYGRTRDGKVALKIDLDCPALKVDEVRSVHVEATVDGVDRPAEYDYP